MENSSPESGNSGSASSSNSIFMTVANLIDTTFGDHEVNVVHFKQLQTVIYLLARQLRILDRRVSIPSSSGTKIAKTSSNLSVTEIKLHATTKKSKKEVRDGSKDVDTDVEPKISFTEKDSSHIQKSPSSSSNREEKQGTTKEEPDKLPIDAISSDKPSPDKKLKHEKSVKQPTKSGTKKTSTTTDIRTMGPQDYEKLLDEVEVMRERELRVIRQRADSHEQREKTPTPIGSLDSVEAIYEKLLVVERVPAEEAEARAARERSNARKGESGPRLAVVTQEEFEALAAIVRQLDQKFGPVATPGFPENVQLMQELRKGASLTNAMAALQLSARLEATEKTLENMLALVTNLAMQTSGIDLTKDATDDIEVILGAPDGKRRHPLKEGKSGIAGEKLHSQSKAYSQTKAHTQTKAHSQTEEHPKKELFESVEAGSGLELSEQTLLQQGTKEVVGTEDIGEKVTTDNLHKALQEFYNRVIEEVSKITTKNAATAENAFKLASQLEGKLTASLNIGNKMENLECLIAMNSQQINSLDTGLSSQMTNYQEELTKMQNDLEIGLENMAEVLANTGGDATAVAELNAHFNDLQEDIDNTIARQKELSDVQCSLSMELDMLRRQIELLRETKSDREEVVDALRDKAGIGELNGLVSLEQFDSVRGDIEQRIKAAYDKFNNQEIIWQKAIDDFLWDLNEKADLVQVEGLRDEICRYLEDFRAKINFIKDIVGVPATAALTKRISRDAACLACAAPAHMKIDETAVPKLPAFRPSTVGAEAPTPTEDGDHGLCYQGFPIPHPIDPRSHVCRRWCGGSHTLMKNTINRTPPCIVITPANRKVTQGKGKDGKMYAMDAPKTRTPCTLCNIPKATPVPSEQQKVYTAESDSDIIPFDFRPTITSVPGTDITPPASFEIE